MEKSGNEYNEEIFRLGKIQNNISAIYYFNFPASVHAGFPRSQDKRVGIAFFWRF